MDDVSRRTLLAVTAAGGILAAATAAGDVSSNHGRGSLRGRSCFQQSAISKPVGTL